MTVFDWICFSFSNCWSLLEPQIWKEQQNELVGWEWSQNFRPDSQILMSMNHPVHSLAASGAWSWGYGHSWALDQSRPDWGKETYDILRNLEKNILISGQSWNFRLRCSLNLVQHLSLWCFMQITLYPILSREAGGVGYLGSEMNLAPADFLCLLLGAVQLLSEIWKSWCPDQNWKHHA